MAKKAEPYKEGSGWPLRRRVFGQDFHVSGQPTKGAAEKAMQKPLTPLSERGKPKGNLSVPMSAFRAEARAGSFVTEDRVVRRARLHHDAEHGRAAQRRREVSAKAGNRAW